MDFSKLLRALLSKVYKKTETEIDAILSATDETEAEKQLLEIDKTRVSEISKPKIGSTFQDGYAKAKKEVLTAIEAKLKETFEIEDGETPLTGEDLISAIVEKKAAAASGTDATKLTTEDLKKLPAFQPIQREFNKQLNQVKTEGENKIKEIEGGYKKKEVFGSVAKQALEVLAGLNPVLPQTQKVAEKQKSSFLNDLQGIEWQAQDDGVFIPMKDGKILDDGHGNALTLDEVVKQKASDWFEFAANNGGGNAGNGKPGEDGKPTGGASNGYPKGITPPKTIQELTKITNDPNIKPEEKLVVISTYEKEFERS